MLLPDVGGHKYRGWLCPNPYTLKFDCGGYLKLLICRRVFSPTRSAMAKTSS